MQWCSDIYVIELNLGMAKNTTFYSGVNKTNTTCRINHAYHAYALFHKILMHDFDLIIRICAGDEIYFFYEMQRLRYTVT